MKQKKKKKKKEEETKTMTILDFYEYTIIGNENSSHWLGGYYEIEKEGD